MSVKTGPACVLAALLAGAAWAGETAAQKGSSGTPQGIAYSPDFFAGLSYRMVGPSRGGRVTAVAGHRAQPSTFYMGASGGGVWKTTDYGQTWHPVSDGYFATGSIGAIGVAESDPQVVYVGTGSDALRSNVIIGKGVYKSLDGGQTWQHVGLERAGNIGALLIHPDNPGLIWVAAIGNPFKPNPERGVFRSRDGGTSWEKVLFVSEQTGAVDLEFAPDNPDEIYATLWRAERRPWTIISGAREGGVYKSGDGGDSWQQLTEGLPGGLRGKADLAVSAAAPERVYVLIEAPGQQGGVYRSDDRGTTWSQVTDFQPIRNRPFYYTNLEAHPRNPDILWGMAESYWKSEDGGESWQRQNVPHGDNHDMWINPDSPNIFIQSNDGGANVTRDGGKTWSSQENQPTAELYQVDVSDDFPYRLYAGQQDNTTISVPSFPPRYMPGGHTALWEAHGGCETGPAVPKPGDPDIVYANCKGRFTVYNRRTGQEQHFYVGFWNLYGHNPKDLAYRFQRVSPIHVSPHDPNRVYHTSQFVHVTEDGGRTWTTLSPDLTAFPPEKQVVSGTPITRDVTGEEHYSTLYEIQESPLEAGVIWVGANDGPIHVTRDGGKTWKNVTPKGLEPYGRVQNIEVSPHHQGKAYATVLRYQLGDFEPYGFRTEDYGRTWTRIATGDNGIPDDFPVRVIREDPDRPGLLYAGTEFGLFISFDDGRRWQAFQLNLPVTPVTDIKLVNQDMVLSTMGRGFWILDDLTPLHGLSEEVASADTHLFAIRAACRLYMPSGSRSTGQPHEPQYPPVGAYINYFLAQPAAAEVRLEILDSQDVLIREFSIGASEGPVLQDGAPERPQPPTVSGNSRLSAEAGMHRFVWDLRYPGPQDPGSDGPAGSGPMVPPGTYQARLSLGERSQSVPFRVRMDPRVSAEGITEEDVHSQVELALRVRDTLSQAHQTAARVEKALKEESAREDVSRALTEIRRQLITDRVRYSQPRLIDQLSYLYQNLNHADQAPGRDAQQRYEELRDTLRNHIEALEEILARISPGGS